MAVLYWFMYWYRWLSYWRNYMRYSNSRYPSWKVYYDDTGTASVPLCREDAKSRCKLFGGTRIVYTRDWKGDLIRGTPTSLKKLGLPREKTHRE